MYKWNQTVCTFCIWLFSNMQRFYEYVRITNLSHHCRMTRRLLICQRTVCSLQNVSSKDTHSGNKRTYGCILCSSLPMSTSGVSQRESNFHGAFLKEEDIMSFALQPKQKVEGSWETKLGNSALWSIKLVTCTRKWDLLAECACARKENEGLMYNCRYCYFLPLCISVPNKQAIAGDILLPAVYSWPY